MATTLWQQNYQVWFSILFFAVKTNVGYAAVADFVLQSETGEQLAETNISSWTPNGNQYFMIDYSVTSTKNKPGNNDGSMTKKHGLFSEDGDTLLEVWLNLLVIMTTTNSLIIIIANMLI